MCFLELPILYFFIDIGALFLYKRRKGNSKVSCVKEAEKDKGFDNAVFVVPICICWLFSAALPSVCAELYAKIVNRKKKSCKYVNHEF